MKTNIVLDDELLKEALKYSKSYTKNGLIHEALKEFVENRKRKDLRELKGKIQFMEDYDYKRAKKRQIALMKKGFNLGTRGHLISSREKLHER